MRARVLGQLLGSRRWWRREFVTGESSSYDVVGQQTPVHKDYSVAQRPQPATPATPSRTSPPPPPRPRHASGATATGAPSRLRTPLVLLLHVLLLPPTLVVVVVLLLPLLLPPPPPPPPAPRLPPPPFSPVVSPCAWRLAAGPRLGLIRVLAAPAASFGSSSSCCAAALDLLLLELLLDLLADLPHDGGVQPVAPVLCHLVQDDLLAHQLVELASRVLEGPTACASECASVCVCECDADRRWW
jgi:hypothetical protein